MYAELNQNDIDNLKLAVDKMKGVDFDAARKMELLLEAYEAQNGDESKLTELQERVEGLPGWDDGDHASHVELTAAMLARALDNVQEWRDSKDDEPLDEAVARLVAVADGPNAEAEKLAKVLSQIVTVADRGTSGALAEIRDLALAAL